MNVSVIIPNYCHARFLNQRIDSVLNQTYSDYEVIILDDCSTDNSREIIESYRNHPKISHIVYNEKNSGSTFIQWEKGFELARGEYIWIAESDDVAPIYLSRRMYECVLVLFRCIHRFFRLSFCRRKHTGHARDEITAYLSPVR